MVPTRRRPSSQGIKCPTVHSGHIPVISHRYSIIVSMVKNQDQDNPEENEEKIVSTDLVSHADAASSHELSLRFVEHHAPATSTDVTYMWCWRNIALSSSLT
ncbi:hypothetical protein AVEN_38622-1 [Araneus ventricosus]|uniref:Uncharacterized protein n=1 Tax=Araneus ventricosus TaxID=182803 RepID=A0A4Y2NJB8_ARAVE|nr:hypothetical protein AVEN_38622-1 [Araneus ventricosus]